MYSHCGDDIVDAPINEASDVVNSTVLSDEYLNIFQTVLVKKSCSLASASSDHFRIERFTGTSCLSTCL